MNCQQARRRLLRNPQSLHDGLRDHLHRCALCRDEAARLQRQDAALRMSLSVHVPAGLRSRILQRWQEEVFRKWH